MIESILKTAKILIVDDKQSNIDILEDLLEELGCTNYQSTTDPRLVVGQFNSFNPDLILLDLMMPHQSGFEVMDQLKHLIPQGTYLPILVLTADITSESKLRALSSGANDILSKPFDLYEVRLRINNLLETRYLYQQLESQNQILEEKVKERTFDLALSNSNLDRANKELAVLDQAKNDFLSLISHELRTPLNGILGFAGLLKKKIDSPELLELLEYLDISAKRLEKFSYQAILITKVKSERFNIKNENVFLNELFNKTTEHNQDEINAKNITVHFQQDKSFDIIKGDKELITICFQRLVENSVKYSPVGGEVVIRVFADEQSTVCEFIDNGTGFPLKILENPFLPFVNAEQHIDKNNGLNLLLIKLIMNAHQGQIEIFNNENKGATVRLTFRKQ
jgi:two-component system, sensor histidine kinase and response regulator